MTKNKEEKAKEKKVPLKERNPYAYYRNGFYALKSAKLVSVVSPFITIFIAKFDTYFKVNPEATLKMSIGCALTCVVGGVAIWKEARKKGDGSQTGTPISSVLGWAVAFALAFCFQTILKDLVFILGCALAGQIAGLGFELGAENRHFYMKEYQKQKVKGKEISEATKEALKAISGKGGNAVE